MGDLTKYCVPKGGHDFKPNDNPFIISKKRSRCEFDFEFDKSMWYDVHAPDYPKNENGNPYRGWNKAPNVGFTQGLLFGFLPWPDNTRRSCMLAEFPVDHSPGFHKLMLYINDKRGNWGVAELMVVEAGVRYIGHLEWFRYDVVAHIKQKNDPSIRATAEMDLTRSNWLPLRTLNGWHGGKYPATQERCFYAKTNYV